MKPAARDTDLHVCTVLTPKPHIGGPIHATPTNVFIGRKLAARAGDFTDCVGETDVVKEGSGTVLIRGMPAARMTDGTVHGGVITGGVPNVLIGGPSATPPGLDRIVDNAKEMDRLRDRIERREDRIKEIEAYIKSVDPRKKGDADAFVKDRLRKILSPTPPNMPKGASDFTEEQVRTAEAGRREAKDLKEAIDRDRERIRQLEDENQKLRRGEDPPRSVPDPNLEKPVRPAS